MQLKVWSPPAQRVRVVCGDLEADLEPSTEPGDEPGWWRLPGTELPTGADYWLLLDSDDTPRADPRSLQLPQGVHGPSRVYDHASYRWHDDDWQGRTLIGAVIYECHIGTFTAGASFDSAITRLPYLVELGVTHVELLPINSFNGVWNWGYDGVGWYAPHEAYGGPDGVKRFVDAAHQLGLAVLLDVVYNHLGPSGNVLPSYGPYLKSGRNTWGDLVNVEQPAVRRFIIDNALMWLRDYHIDGLRLDAVHALHDESPVHILAELSAEVDELSAQLSRPLPLIAESDLNDPVMITAREQGGHGLDAQWDDDVHHALHALLTDERQGYYDDFGSLSCLRKVLTCAFFHDGIYSTFRRREHGRPVDRASTPGYRFVVCLQNHDQVGNRAVGDRLPEITSPARLQIGAVLLLTSPFTPMLWMGEEWAASTRWPFFTSHPEPDLALATGRGRIAEFAEHGWDVSQMIDPQDPAAYQQAMLNWDERDEPAHAQMLTLYRTLIGLRRSEPELADPRLDQIDVEIDESARTVIVHRGSLRVLVNLSDQTQHLELATTELVLATGECHRDTATVALGADTAAIVRVRR